ncbi:hypothetical protein HZH68_010375 [Vespula germanica]|uniref:Uncharacterized protein n=1 Tax=Vespula germanica TaxID=30212 RepID=A0A834JXQ1_VESGE|nr:hypothetical protein HZH68_010375 [Vespula germanica]
MQRLIQKSQEAEAIPDYHPQSDSTLCIIPERTFARESVVFQYHEEEDEDEDEDEDEEEEEEEDEEDGEEEGGKDGGEGARGRGGGEEEEDYEYIGTNEGSIQNTFTSGIVSEFPPVRNVFILISNPNALSNTSLVCEPCNDPWV